jgi:hypothetical protein
MAMDFPNSPTVNQTYTVGDKTWKWTGTAWEIVATRPAMRTVADTPPASPIVGDEWFNSLVGRTYTWFDSYWVEVNTNSIVGASGLNGVASASAPLSYNSTNNNISVQSSPAFTDGITTNAGADGQVLKLKARSSDNFNQIAWYNSAGSNFTGLWQVNSDASVNIVRNTTPGGTAQNFQNSIIIAAAGQVTLPSQPMALIDGNSNAWANSVAGTTVKSMAISQSAGGITWDGSTGRATVPTAGWYQVTFTTYQGGNTTQRYYLQRNGATFAMNHHYNATNDTQTTITGLVSANANDYFQTYLEYGSVNNYYGSMHTFMTIAKVA